ncbi:1-acyl-sn-glycerol-3-phosphate acyltransferase [Calidifontibacter sp. DB0510]|uniref:1-acyl-sn-glycerol-3-phosphate acyltransferase n=2 Tax=Metallococcus carri TaxID=1656884 RepID=A0A967EBC1_9MICO|nr:lysophospholipid acyltransferase family protein [Metallococcus carri]NHN56779.1 1-acyl-sn-glycerol-3-phosphate acyltransferase [Metallococcus carri]NOP37844.1 1-acyl-sn-glycerol-3-phosphate acyltransferase [Calidifontibacter sp. DB2511S]
MLYLTTRMVVGPLARTYLRATVHGVDNIPATGGVLLAANHLSFVDSLVIPMVAPRQVVFLAKSDYFTGTGIKGTATRAWFTSMGMVPVDRDDSKAAQHSLEIALQVLREGRAFGIYPEGTRSRDGRLYRGRTGVAHLALTAGVPIVPVGLIGTQNVQPVGTNRLTRAPFTVSFGAPIQVEGRFDGMPTGRARRELTDEVMDAIAALSGQERADGYNERAH